MFDELAFHVESRDPNRTACDGVQVRKKTAEITPQIAG